VILAEDSPINDGAQEVAPARQDVDVLLDVLELEVDSTHTWVVCGEPSGMSVASWRKAGSRSNFRKPSRPPHARLARSVYQRDAPRPQH
jgi:hypothetical protein